MTPRMAGGGVGVGVVGAEVVVVEGVGEVTPLPVAICVGIFRWVVLPESGLHVG